MQLIIISIAVICIYIVSNHIYNTPPDDDNVEISDFLYSEHTEEDYKKEILSKLEQQNKQLNRINTNIGCLTFIIVVPIILYLVIKFISFEMGYNILQDLL